MPDVVDDADVDVDVERVDVVSVVVLVVLLDCAQATLLSSSRRSPGRAAIDWLGFVRFWFFGVYEC